MLPKEFGINFDDGKTATIEADWDHVVNEDQTIKIIVSLRDVTETRRLNRQVDKQKKESTLLSQIINISPERFAQFKQIGQDLLDDARLSIKQKPMDLSCHRRIYFSYHTLKGIARSLHFDELSQLIHLAEGSLVSSDSDLEQADTDQIATQFQQINELFQTHIELNDGKLGRGIDPEVAMIPKHLLRQCLHSIDERDRQHEFDAVILPLKRFCFRTVEDIFYEHLSSIKAIADQLTKPLPKTRIHGDQIGFDEKASSCIDRALLHLIRNSIDHGIEDVLERRRLGKPERGLITIEVVDHEETILIYFADDGSGLNVKGLLQKAAVMPETQTPSVELIESLVFREGLSTAANVSDISGRGIGMAAVRNILADIKATIEILPNEQETPMQQSHMEFKWRISIPRSFALPLAVSNQQVNKLAS